MCVCVGGGGLGGKGEGEVEKEGVWLGQVGVQLCDTYLYI